MPENFAPKPSTVFLSLGSNLGARLENLRAAARALGRGPLLTLTGSSKVYETEPVSVRGEHPYYLNCALRLECGLPAMELLRFCQGVEAALGRSQKGQMAPRTLDVDILLFGEEEISSVSLRVPHRGMGRGFNLRSVADIEPGLLVPGWGVVEEMLREADLSGVRAVEEKLFPEGSG